MITQPLPAYQALEGAASDRNRFSIQLALDLADTINTEVLVPDTLDFSSQPAITLDSSRHAVKLGFTAPVIGVCRRGDQRDTADRLDPVRLPVIIDELDHHLPRRSSFGLGKIRGRLMQVSLACFNSRFSRSACRRVSGVQSILGAMTPMVARWEW